MFTVFTLQERCIYVYGIYSKGNVMLTVFAVKGMLCLQYFQ